MIELNFKPGSGCWAEGENADKLRNNHFGENDKGKLILKPEEVLYIIDLQNGMIHSEEKTLDFSDMLEKYACDESRLMINYNAYRDWRDRGLVIKRFDKKVSGKNKMSGSKKYPSKKINLKKLKATVHYDMCSSMGVIDDYKTGHMLFNEWWFGQIGVYKQDRGDILKLNVFEVVFLSKHFGLTIFDVRLKKNTTYRKLLEDISKRREFAANMYQAYEDWRLQGYIVKTGFKFGTHFRIYFPGATPANDSKNSKWIHSKHVIHVFPKEEKLLISEWARAVRVAHGVKKTFILGIPKLTKKDYVDYPADFVAYRRKKKSGSWVRETPKDGPRYLLAAVSEEEHIGGLELASLLYEAESRNLDLILSITDRETAITYYELKKIELKGSNYDYYEIEWMRP